MRFNKQELLTLATQPSQKFDKEGVLFLRERQEGFFRRTEISLERWCRLRGNLLFYFKSKDQWSDPVGVIVLENYTVKLDPFSHEPPFGFNLVFEGGMGQHIGTTSEEERDSWLEAIQDASYGSMRAKFLQLQQKLELKRGHDPDLDVHMWRLRRGTTLDPTELPVCEVSMSCDNLLCDGHGRPPNATIIVHVYLPTDGVWLKYANTEVISKSSNPTFLKTVCFRSSDGLTNDSNIRFTAYDIRETVSLTATPIGKACVTLSSCQESDRLRIPLKDCDGNTVGFLSLAVWSLELEASNQSTESTPMRSILHHDPSIYCHRRSQSLPPRLGFKLKIPNQGAFKHLFGNASIHTYRFHSGLGGDITVHEVMAESKICFQLPQQLLGLWMNEEKELLQEVAGMGELVEPWHSLQVEMLDRHLQLLHLYSQAKENLAAHKGGYFKPSSRKNDRSLEFAPINLHLQRMWVQNETLKKSDFYDIITVGAFTAHSHKSKNGGLIKLIQQVKESPMKGQNGAHGVNKTAMAHDAIQAIKQLRREVVDSMRTLMKLAKEKKTQGMLPLCDEMITKTRTLLTLWDPGLVEEALSFIEEHKVSGPTDDGSEDDGDSGVGHKDGLSLALSPFKRITQQLQFAELKSPDLDDLVTTPESPRCLASFWHPPPLSRPVDLPTPRRDQFVIFPEAEESTKKATDENSNVNESEDEDGKTAPLINGYENEMGKKFLDTHAMCSSPSANYYKPTDEPEPWDLTQLNIEASVMCLVSKVKFLCGRCSSPAVRLRNTKHHIGRSQSFRSELCAAQETVTSQPSNKSQLHSRTSSEDCINQAVESATAVRNKFTEGLELSTITDWTSELKPSMRKLRQAMDGLLKTARLTHSVFRLQEDKRAAQRACNVRYRRHVCFSHSLTALVTGLLSKLWCQKPDPVFLHILSSVGPLVSFEGLLTYHGDEIDMWGDMVVAVEDLRTVTFTLTPTRQISKCGSVQEQCRPRVLGSRSSLVVQIPVPDSVHSLLPLNSSSKLSFHVTPVFFNIGINEMATLAESLGATKPQEQSNMDNFSRLNEYYHRFKKLGVPDSKSFRGAQSCPPQAPLCDLMDQLKIEVYASKNKNVKVLQLVETICRKMKGIRFTSCKSAKDRTGMAVSLEQFNVLCSEYDLAEHEYQKALNCMRSEGARRDNTLKNTGVRKYALNSLQIMTFPKWYRPPAGTYGSNQS